LFARSQPTFAARRACIRINTDRAARATRTWQARAAIRPRCGEFSTLRLRISALNRQKVK